MLQLHNCMSILSSFTKLYIKMTCIILYIYTVYTLDGRVRVPRPKRLKIINHKVNKTMHFTVLCESAYSLLSSRAIGNFLFPSYEVVSASCERCCSLRPIPNALIGWDVWWHPSQASTDQHPSPPVTHGLSVCVFRASEQRTFIIKMSDKIIVGVNQLMR